MRENINRSGYEADNLPKMMSFAKAVAVPASLDTKHTYVPRLDLSTLPTLKSDPSDKLVVSKNHSTFGVGIPTAEQ